MKNEQTVSSNEGEETGGESGFGLDGRELISLSSLNDTVENEDVSVGLGLEDENVLEEGLLGVKDLLDPVKRNQKPKR